MKKNMNIAILAAGILLFIISYFIDNRVDLFFKQNQTELLSLIFGVITNFGLVIIVMAVIPSLILYKKNKKSVYLLLSTFIASFVLAFVIKLIFLRQRPDVTLSYPIISLINYSFPSMHSMTVFSLLPALAKNFKKQKTFFILFAFLVAFSRIYFGLHFLSDVVFGAILGYFTGDYLLHVFEKKKWA